MSSAYVVGVVVDDLVGARAVILMASHRHVVVRDEMDSIFSVWGLPPRNHYSDAVYNGELVEEALVANAGRRRCFCECFGFCDGFL